MRTTLIIEDDPDANDILADLVRQRHFEPLQALDGEQGLRLARESKPDIVFLDLMLPGVDGYKICELLKTDRKTNGIPIIMVTALTADEHRLRGFRVGADAYVTKPYTPGDLDHAILTVDDRVARLAEQGVEHAVEINFSSQLQQLDSVNEMVSLLMRYTPLSEKDIQQIRTALQEMGSNAIEWGNKNDPNKIVRLLCHVYQDRVELNVTDEGEGFDPRNVPHASDGDDDDPMRHFEVREQLGLREGGFGMLMARGLVDRVQYNEKGNSVTLTKHFPKP